MPIVWFMALAAALGTASIYPLQPAIADVAGSLHVSLAAVGAALACGPIGYLVGLATLVPLVDRFRPSSVVSVQFLMTGLALAASAAVHTPWALGLAIGMIGAGSSVGAQLSSIAGRFATPQHRGTALGIVTAGIAAGILAGRIVGGWLTEAVGWRAMLLILAASCGATAAVTFMALPRACATASGGYLRAVLGLPRLLAQVRTLRSAAVRGALWFFAFCVVWSGLAVALAQPPLSYSAEQIGLFAVAGLAGIAATRVAGVWTDRVGAHRVILIGLVIALVAASVLAFSLRHTVVVVICLALFDAGLFAAQVANQSTVLAIDPGAPARFNSAYMVVYFIGGSAGTALGAVAVQHLGWPASSLIAAAAVLSAAALLGVEWMGERRIPRNAAISGNSSFN